MIGLILCEINTTKTKQSISGSFSGKYLNGIIVNSKINQVYIYFYMGDNSMLLYNQVTVTCQ